MLVKWKLRKKIRTLLVILSALFICGTSLVLLITDENSRFAPANLTNSYLNAIWLQELEISVLQEKSSGCEPPRLDTYSPEALRFNGDLPRVVCEGKDWVQCYLDECRVTKDILLAKKDIYCIYKDILYVDDYTTNFGVPSKVFGSGVYKLVASDQVDVTCTSYDYDGAIPSRWSGYKVGLRRNPKPETPQPLETPKPRPPSDPINVLIIAFDSASHNGFIRRMPKSHEVITKELKAVVLNKYNVVGDGTAAALFPLFTGKTSFEHEDYRKALSKARVDEKLLVFHAASTLGYRTLYFENMPWIETFQNRHNGFARQPADHYLRPVLMLESDAGRKWWNGDKGRYCIGDTAQYALMFNLTRQFYQLDGKRFSFTFVSDISHDDFNVITTADEELVGLLRSFKDEGKLEDTVLVVMGDHGTRYKSIRETYQGKLEEQLPFMAIRLPPKLVNSRPDALKALEDNANVLTTPFDIHTTLLDVLGASELRNKFTIKGSDLPRGMSLLKPIPLQRSCGEAGVVSYWCACAAWRAIPPQSPQYERAAQALLQYINSVTSTKRSLCRVRKLANIEWVMEKISSSEHLDKAKSEEEYGKLSSDYYQAKIITSPGHGVYEGAMRYLREEDRYLISLNDISRINDTDFGIVMKTCRGCGGCCRWSRCCGWATCAWVDDMARVPAARLFKPVTCLRLPNPFQSMATNLTASGWLHLT